MADLGPTGLYHVYGDADLLLYIGVSNNFGRRWAEHARKQSWWGERRRMTVYWYDTRDEALDAEALAIFTKDPKCNIRHRRQAQRYRKLQRTTAATKTAERDRRARALLDQRCLELLDSPDYEAMLHGTSVLAGGD